MLERAGNSENPQPAKGGTFAKHLELRLVTIFSAAGALPELPPSVVAAAPEPEPVEAKAPEPATVAFAKCDAFSLERPSSIPAFVRDSIK